MPYYDDVCRVNWILTSSSDCSGIARFAAGRRIGAASLKTARLTNAFKPTLSAFGARTMASEALKAGRIHQVIGAVVDVVRLLCCPEKFCRGISLPKREFGASRCRHNET